MKFAVLFEDNPGTGGDVRGKYMNDHLAFLERHSDKIMAAGPLKSADGSGAGGLWIVEARDGATVQQLIEEDPFWPTGLRKSVQVLTWTQVFSSGKRLLQA